MPGPQTKIRFYSRWRAFPIRLRFRIALGKYLFQRKKYPLFTLNPSKGGLIKTFQVQRKLGLHKIINFNHHYYFALTVPKWPSEAFDHMAANGGLNITAAGTRFKPQIDVAVLAVTRKCNYDCKHCYEYFNLAEDEIVPIERWKKVIKELQETGVSIITLSGGEPMLRYRGLLELLESSDKNLSEFHIHTSGNEVTPERAVELKNAGLAAAGIGLDDVDPERHDTFRGYQGAFKVARQAVKYFQDAGVFTYLNLCLRKNLIQSGDLGKYFEMAKDLGVGAIRFIEPKPCGRYISENADNLFSEDDKQAAADFFLKASREKKYRDYPLISYDAYFEQPERLGCMMGGKSHFHIDSSGNVEPCVFLPISFGNIMDEDFLCIFKNMRKATAGRLHESCPAVYLMEKIRIKKNQGIDLPVPYQIIEKEWQEMF